ncbi:MAG: 30S ribosomal protein S8 [Spirochaetes bacterium]|nr:MAG: 30S ribosomal protein S8 [Spirochaetota bacterium]
MGLSDPIADMLTVIRNANRVKKEKVDIPSSKLKLEIIKILKNEGYIKNFKLIEEGRKSYIRIYLKYTPNGESVIHDLKRVSRPSLRVYKKKNQIPRVYNGYGTSIISTSKGVLTDKKARESNVGGEVICYIW